MIKVIVVDDSAFMRKMISDMINKEEDMEVIATSRNGEDFIKKLESLKPDVVTLDVEMPIMDGIKTLKTLKEKNYDLKILMLSSVTDSASKVTLDCLKEGAVDFIAKPSGAISLDIDKVSDELVNKIRAINKSKKTNSSLYTKKTIEKEQGFIDKKVNFIKNSNKTYEAVVIAASTGGPRAIHSVVENLPGDLNVPVFVVQHMPQGFTKTFAERLNQSSSLTVVEATDNEIIRKNVVYIAPGGYHMEIGKNKRISLNKEPSIWGVRPAADKLFISASSVYGAKIVSVVLTGMGRDGSNGTAEVKSKGGYTIAEDESTSIIYGMPKAAFETGMVDEVVPLYDVSRRITELIK